MSAAAAEIASDSNEFDIFAHRPIQTSVIDTIETAYQPIATVDQNDLEFFIPADNDTYINLISNCMSEVNLHRARESM